MRTEKLKKFVMMAVAVAMLIAMVPALVFADETPTVQTVSLKRTGGYEATIGGSVYITITAKSNTTNPYKVVLNTVEGITIKNATSGIFSTTDAQSIIYELSIAENASKGAKSLMCQAVSSDGGKVLQELEVSIVLNKSESKVMSVSSNLVTMYYSLSEGDSIVEGNINTLTVEMYNKGNERMEDAKVMLTLPSCLTIQSGAAAQYVGTFSPGKSVTASFPIIVKEKTESGSYPIKVTIAGTGYTVTYGPVTDLSGNTSYGLQTNASNTTSYSEDIYVPVIGTKDKKEEEKEDESEDKLTPILMVSSYSYGESAVVSGNDFNLGLTLRNTNSEKDMYNIKVTVDAGGVFIPVGSSNSFYIEKIAAGSSAGHSIKMNCSQDATQAPHAVSVTMSYQDKAGHNYSASDSISVPVVGEVRFKVDDILDPGWLTADSQGYVSATYYNLGKSTLSNMTIKAEGDFTMDGNGTYFVGNMNPGKSDYYNFNFWPNGEGPCNGKLTFTFEDAAGEEHIVEKEFSFNIGPAYVWDDPGDDWGDIEEPQTGLPTWAWIAIAVGGAIILLIVIKKIVKKRKAKKQEALELDE